MKYAQTRTIVLTRAQAKVLANIKLMRDSKGLAELSLNQLVELTGIPRSSVSYAIHRLNTLNLLFTKQGKWKKPTVHWIVGQGSVRSVLVQGKAAGGHS